MINYQDLLQEVNKRTHQQVIINLFNHQLKNHNSFCGCNYCQKLREYVEYKKSLQRLKSQDDYYYDIRSYNDFKDSLDKFKVKVLTLKYEKDKLKTWQI
jgi:hypothetical protein